MKIEHEKYRHYIGYLVVPFYFEKIVKWSVIIIDSAEQEEKTNCVIPIWKKYTLSVQEAAEYFGFSDKKIRKIVDEHENDNFILWNGTRPRIKRQLFEKFVDEKLTAI